MRLSCASRCRGVTYLVIPQAEAPSRRLTCAPRIVPECAEGVALKPQSVGRLSSGLGLALIAALTLYPTSGTSTLPMWCLFCDDLATVDAVLNVLLFVPFGLGLGLAGVRARRAFYIIAAVTLTVETLQYTVIVGRDASFRDLATNVVGGMIGLMIARYSTALLHPSRRMAIRLASVWAVLWLGVETVAAFALLPSFPNTRYFGQRQPTLRQFDRFPGTLVDGWVNDVRMPVGANDSLAIVRSRFAAEHRLDAAAVVTGGERPTYRIAPAISIFDQFHREILVLGQWGTALVFRAHTHARELRLRPLAFELDRVFPRGRGAQSGDTISVGATLGPRSVRLVARRGGATLDHETRVGPALAWVLVSPLEIPVGTITTVGSALWLFCMLAPLGYWMWTTRRTSGSGERDNSRRTIVASSLMFLVLLVLVLEAMPRAIGISGATAPQWTAALAGFAAGWFVSSRVAMRFAERASLRR